MSGSIQVKTYNSEPDLGLESSLEGPVGGAAPKVQWSFADYDAEVWIEDGEEPLDLGLSSVIGMEPVGGLPVAVIWWWGLEKLPEANKQRLAFTLSTEFGADLVMETDEILELE